MTEPTYTVELTRSERHMLFTAIDVYRRDYPHDEHDHQGIAAFAYQQHETLGRARVKLERATPTGRVGRS